VINGARTYRIISYQAAEELRRPLFTLKRCVNSCCCATAGCHHEARIALVGLAARYRIPAPYPSAQFVAAGGLVSLGANFPEAFRQAGEYLGQVLNDEKPENLPVMQVTRIDLAINMKTAKPLGLTIPASLLARADEIIE
jgi:ABC-type uncharacterized transport system substrate-binding protein